MTRPRPVLAYAGNEAAPPSALFRAGAWCGVAGLAAAVLFGGVWLLTDSFSPVAVNTSEAANAAARCVYRVIPEVQIGLAACGISLLIAGRRRRGPVGRDRAFMRAVAINLLVVAAAASGVMHRSGRGDMNERVLARWADAGDKPM